MTTQSDSSTRKDPAWVRIVPWIILVLVGTGALLVALQWNRIEADQAEQVTDNAAVQTDTSILHAKTSAYVKNVYFSDFQQVHAGDVLVELDDREARANLLHAQAALDKAEAVLASLGVEQAAQRAMVAQARAAAIGASSKFQLAEQDHRRFAALADSGAVTGQEADSARSNADALRAGQAGSLATVTLQQRQGDVLAAQLAQRKADVLAARAALESAKIALAYTRITAPADGTVGQRQVQVGSLVSTGSAIASFVASTPPYVVANYKETQMERILPSQVVDIEVDSFPGQRLQGRVTRLGAASGATFAAIPADNATGNFTKVTQRIPLRIDLDAGQALIPRLRAGMSVTTRIHTRG
jgi:membrane fusion protein (multidrug efflux system)